MEPHAQEVDRHGTRPAHGSPAPPVPAPLAAPAEAVEVLGEKGLFTAWRNGAGYWLRK